jgi:hypothetical protein
VLSTPPPRTPASLNRCVGRSLRPQLHAGTPGERNESRKGPPTGQLPLVLNSFGGVRPDSEFGPPMGAVGRNPSVALESDTSRLRDGVIGPTCYQQTAPAVARDGRTHLLALPHRVHWTSGQEQDQRPRMEGPPRRVRQRLQRIRGGGGHRDREPWPTPAMSVEPCVHPAGSQIRMGAAASIWTGTASSSTPPCSCPPNPWDDTRSR